MVAAWPGQQQAASPVYPATTHPSMSGTGSTEGHTPPPVAPRVTARHVPTEISGVVAVALAPVYAQTATMYS